jgi:hypothetical protein
VSEFVTKNTAIARRPVKQAVVSPDFDRDVAIERICNLIMGAQMVRATRRLADPRRAPAWTFVLRRPTEANAPDHLRRLHV